MGLEIERRYLVQGDQWQEFIQKSEYLQQGYLTSNIGGWTVRVRIQGQNKSWITIKSPKNAIENHEFEYAIPIKEAQSILKLTPYKILKTRYQLKLPGGSWVVDCFEAKNIPLVIAEVELSNKREVISKPSWCVEEITGKYHWSNAALAVTSIADWPIEKRLNHQERP